MSGCGHTAVQPWEETGDTVMTQKEELGLGDEGGVLFGLPSASQGVAGRASNPGGLSCKEPHWPSTLW